MQYFPVRYLHAFLCFVAFVNQTCVAMLGLTITQMVKPIIETTLNASHGSSLTKNVPTEETCPFPDAPVNDDGISWHDDVSSASVKNDFSSWS